MKASLLLATVILALAATPAAAQVHYTRTANGSWTNTAAWTPAGVPGASDTANINGRSVSLDAPTTVAVLILPASGNSALSGPAPLTVTDTLRWERGSTTVTGTITVGPAATFRLSGTGSFGVGPGGELVNQGTMLWETPREWGGAGLFTNEGTVEIHFDTADTERVCFNSENPAFINAAGGVIRRSGAGMVTIYCGFNNDGTVEIAGGGLELRGFNSNGGVSGGAFEVGAGSILRITGGNRTITASGSITGAGTLEVQPSNHTLAIAGAYDLPTTRIAGGRVDFNADVTMPTLEVTGGTLGGSGVVTVAGAMTWTAGRMEGSGETIIQPDLSLNGATVSVAGSRTVRLAGATSWEGEADLTNGSSDVTIINAGTMTSSGAGERRMFAGTFRNEGTIIHQSGRLRFNSGFDNAGTVNVVADTLVLSGFNSTGGTDTGNYLLGADARLEFAGGNRTLSASAEIAGAGTVAFAGGNVTNSATWRPGSSPGVLHVSTGYPAGSGVVEIELGGMTPGVDYDQLAVGTTATLGGTLRVVLLDGFAPQPGDRFLVVPAAGVTGTFAALDLPPGVEASVETTPAGLELVIGAVTATEPGTVPTEFALRPARPNPAFGQTKIGYDVPDDVRVRLVLVDVLGRQLATLADDQRAPGSYETTLDGYTLPAGVYFVRMEARDFAATRRLTIAR